jgi:2-polyprenyl-3-methyl-5-hydroxy-6-metoxy-1,4-benzoquinol methylase
MLLEHIACPACGGKNHKLVFKSKDFRLKTSADIFSVVKCLDCGFLFLNPRPLRSEVIHAYTLDFHKSDETILYKFIKPCFSISEESNIRALKEYKESGRLLDVGCGNGSFILAMQEKGYDVWGVELNLEAKKFTSQGLEGRISYQEIEECRFPPNSFDIITMFQSLEHIYDLSTTLKEIRRILKDDGIVFICVPNADFFEFRLFGPYNYNLEVPRHLYFFTKKSLSALLLKNGFRPDRFLRNSIFEIVLTPAAFYYSAVYFLNNDLKLRINALFNYLFFIPAVFFRLVIRFLLPFEEQNIKLICKKDNVLDV